MSEEIEVVKENNWHREVTKEHICIWSDEWEENRKKQLEKEKENVDS